MIPATNLVIIQGSSAAPQNYIWNSAPSPAQYCFQAQSGNWFLSGIEFHSSTGFHQIGAEGGAAQVGFGYCRFGPTGGFYGVNVSAAFGTIYTGTDNTVIANTSSNGFFSGGFSGLAQAYAGTLTFETSGGSSSIFFQSGFAQAGETGEVYSVWTFAGSSVVGGPRFNGYTNGIFQTFGSVSSAYFPGTATSTGILTSGAQYV